MPPLRLCLIPALILAVTALLAASPAAATPCYTLARWQELVENDWRAQGIETVMRKSGLCIEEVKVPAARARVMVQQGLVDIDMWRPELELNEMTNVLAVPTGLPGFGVALVVRKDLPIEIRSLNDMLPYTLITALAYKMADTIPYIQRYRLEHFSKMEQGFGMLLMHRADGLLMDRGLYRSMVRNREIDPAKFRAPLMVMPTPTHVVVHASRRELIPVLDLAVRKALAEGAFATDDNDPPS